MHRLKKLREIAGPALFIIGLIFISLYAIENARDFASTYSHANGYLLFLSIVGLVAYNILVSLLFWRTLTRLGFDVKPGSVVRTLLLSQAAKYVPGKIWMIVFQKSSFRDAIPLSGLMLANVYFILLAFVITFCVALTVFAVTLNSWLLVPSLVIGGAGFLWAQRSTIFWRCATLITKVQASWSLEHDFFKVQALQYVLIISAYVAAHYTMVRSLYDLSTDNALLVVATLALSWTLSSLVVVIPSGIVLREIIFFAVTSSFATDLDSRVIASIAVSSRFWLVGVDLLGVVFALVYSGLMGRRLHE